MGKKMAVASGSVNKTQAIKDALAQDPNASPSRLAAELTARGIEVSSGYVSTIKTSLKSQGTTSPPPSAPQEAPAAASAPEAGNGRSKSQAIKEALAKNPSAKPKDVAAELNAQGLDVTPTYVRIVKSKSKTKRKAKRKAPAAAQPAATAATASRESGNGSAMVDVTSLVKAKSLVDQVGGIEKAQQLLAALKKLQ